MSSFRLRARVGVSIPATCGRRGITPAFGYGPPHPGAGGTSTLLTSALPGAHYNTSDDSRLAAYQAETEYEKASWLTLYDVAGDRDVRIPAPFQIGAVFIKIPEVALDLAGGTDTLAGPRFVWSLSLLRKSVIGRVFFAGSRRARDGQWAGRSV